MAAAAIDKLSLEEESSRKKDALSPNARGVLALAREIALDKNCFLMGTEHLLLGILRFRCDGDKPTSTARWLISKAGKSMAELTAAATKIADTTANAEYTSGGALTSPNLARALELATSLAQPAATEHLLLGALLAAEVDALPNACSKVCASGSVSAEALVASLQLAASVGPAALVRAGRACLVGERRFGIAWGESIPSHDKDSNSGCVVPLKHVTGAGPTKNTHFVYSNLLCGISAGNMRDADLRALVEEGGVDTFVCLQAHYEEYCCRNYPRILREFATTDSAFPPRPLRFIHCPVPDFGVLSDESLLALTGVLQRELAAGHTLYVHCMGGHGRTGTVLVNLIGAVDGISFTQAMQVLRKKHAARGCRGHCALGAGRLEDATQEEQAIKVQGAMRRKCEIYN